MQLAKVNKIYRKNNVNNFFFLKFRQIGSIQVKEQQLLGFLVSSRLSLVLWG